MSKQSKSGRASKKNLPENAAWFEDRLEQNMLDLEALSAMSIEDVNAELKSFKPDQKSLVESINARLPAGAAIPAPEQPAARSRKRSNRPASTRAADRKATGNNTTVKRRTSRFFGIRSALILSAIIIAVSLFVPRFFRDLQDNELTPATALEDSTPPADLNRPPTYIVGPAVDELVRGVRYTIEGIQQVVFKAPLPTNPGNMTASFRMEMIIDNDGKVTRLTPMSAESTDFERVVVDSLLHWQFSTLPESADSSRAIVTVEYFPE